MATTPTLRMFMVEAATSYPTPTPEVRVFVAEAGGIETTPFLQMFMAESSAAYQIPTPEIRAFVAEALNHIIASPTVKTTVLESNAPTVTVTPALRTVDISSSGGSANKVSPAIRAFTADFVAQDVFFTRFDGKQIVDNTISSAGFIETYSKADGSVAFTAALSAGGHKFTSVGNGTASTDLINKSQLDSWLTGADWKEPVLTVGLIGNATASTINGLSAAAGDVYVVTDSGTITLGSYMARAGDVLEFNQAVWVRLRNGESGYVPAGTRMALSTQTALVSPYTDSTDDGKVLLFSGASNTGADTSEAYEGATVPIVDENSSYETNVFSFNGAVPTGSWIQISGANVTPGNGLSKTGNILNVNTGNGTTISSDAVVANLATGGGVKFSASQMLLEPNDFAGTGLQDDGSDNLRLAAPGNGLTGGAGSALAVLAQNTSVVVSGSGVKAALPTSSNKDMAALITTADGQQATSTTIASAIAAGSFPMLTVNGVQEPIGNGTKVGVPAYISGDGGTTARAYSAIASGDTIRWNGSISGYQLELTFVLDLHYYVA